MGYPPDAIIDDDPNTFWTPPDHVSAAEIIRTFERSHRFDRVLLREAITEGQRIERFAIDAWRGDARGWEELARGETVGFQTIVRFPPTTTDRVRLRILESRVRPTLAAFSVHEEPWRFEAPTIARDAKGRITIEGEGMLSTFRYTLDGSNPTARSPKYTQPIDHPGPVQVRAREVLGAARMGPVTEATLDLSKHGWRIRSVSSEQAPGERASHAIDGDPTTIWHTSYGSRTPRPPHQITIDLGSTLTLDGFTYLPRPRGLNGTVIDYRVAVSVDGQTFTMAKSGAFGNIARSPVEQRVIFESPVRARFLRFGALSAVSDNPWASAAEIGVIAKPSVSE